MSTDEARQVEGLFADLQGPSNLQRYGPINAQSQETAKDLIDLAARTKLEEDSKDELRRWGFNVIAEDPTWVFFRKGDTGFIEKQWENLYTRELGAIYGDKRLPQDLADTYKICMDIAPSKLPDAIEILGSQFANLPIYGKVAKGELMQRENFPDIVLYVRGMRKNEILDFVVSLSYAVKQQLGTTETRLDAALEIIPGSGVYITQGNYQAKQTAEQLGNADKYYSPDRSLFATEYEQTLVYASRRKNQFLIEENLYLFSNLPPSHKILNLQVAAFDGIDINFNIGIRERDVIVGEYIAPPNEKVPALMDILDQRYQELINALPDKPTYEQAARLAAFLYTTSILIHPLENGNGQSCTNLATSCLYDLGFRRIYTNPFMDGKLLRSKAFGLAVTKEAPTSDWTIPREERLRRAKEESERQNHALGIVTTGIDSAYWGTLKRYIVEGDIRSATEAAHDRSSPYNNHAVSYITRLHDIAEFLQTNLVEKPVGSKRLSFAEQQQAHKEALLY